MIIPNANATSDSKRPGAALQPAQLCSRRSSAAGVALQSAQFCSKKRAAGFSPRGAPEVELLHNGALSFSFAPSLNASGDVSGTERGQRSTFPWP